MANPKIRKELIAFLRSNAKIITAYWSDRIFDVPGHLKDKAIIPKKVHAAGMAKFVQALISDIEKPHAGLCEAHFERLIFKEHLSASSAEDTIQGLIILRTILVDMLIEECGKDFKKLKAMRSIIIKEIDRSVVCLSRIYKKRDFVRLETIMRYGKKLIAIHDLNKLCDLILEAAVIESNSDRASIMLVEKDNYLHIKSSIGLPKKYAQNAKIRIGKGIAGTVAKTAEPIIISE